MSKDDLNNAYVGEGHGLFGENSKPDPGRKLREVVADAYAFVRSAEANAAIASVTLDQLIEDQILRNGESARSNKSKYDPYSYDAAEDEPASDEPVKRANFPGGSDTERPTKLDRVLAIVNSIGDVVSEIMKMEPSEVAEKETYSDIADVAMPEEE